MPFERIDTVLFDLDGTLLDSVPGIVESFLASIDEFKIKNPPSKEEIIASLGRPLASQMHEFSGCQKLAQEMTVYYMNHNQKKIPEMSLFSGAMETIQHLKDKGYKVGVVTAKYKTSAYLTFEKYGFLDMMDVLVTGSDTEKHKPDPEPLFFAMNKLKSTPEGTVYIGDATHDIQAAHAAKCLSVAVLWGPNSRDSLAKENPTRLCTDFFELMSSLNGFGRTLSI